MADQRGEGGSYLDVWGVMFKEPWRHLLHEVANLSPEDAALARVVVGGGSSATAEAPVAEPAKPEPPASPFCRRDMPPPPGADR